MKVAKLTQNCQRNFCQNCNLRAHFGEFLCGSLYAGLERTELSQIMSWLNKTYFSAPHIMVMMNANRDEYLCSPRPPGENLDQTFSHGRPRPPPRAAIFNHMSAQIKRSSVFAHWIFMSGDVRPACHGCLIRVISVPPSLPVQKKGIYVY